MDDDPNTPPSYDDDPTTPFKTKDDANLTYTTPTSLASSPHPPYPSRPHIPPNLTQAMITASPALKRLQRDLLILTSFHDTDTLHWRPSWFQQAPYSANFWTLYNPPNVVTELLPQQRLGRLVYTRRMRREGDPEPVGIKSWEQWNRVCDMRGVPRDWLSEEMVGFMRLGLRRDGRGRIAGKMSTLSTTSSFFDFLRIRFRC